MRTLGNQLGLAVAVFGLMIGATGQARADIFAEPGQPARSDRYPVRPVVHRLEFFHDDLYWGLPNPVG